MSFDDQNFDNPDESQLPEESNNNRTFLIAAGILGGIILISIACLVGVYLYTRSINTANQAQAQAATQTAEASSLFVQQALTATFEAAAVLPTNTVPPSPTAVVAQATATNTPDPNATATGGAVAGLGTPAPGTQAAATATVGAALTQAASAQLTIVPTSTALPQTGLVEDVGIPGLVVMALAFIIVILLARRMRTAPVR
jgi:type II secretory pathway pseudopilin PulG